MPNTDRMKWPYPAEHVDPWYDAFVGLMKALDASGYAAREDRNLILKGGGTFSFDATSGSLSWTSTLSVLSPIVGFFTEVSAGSATLNEGQILYLDLVRSPTKTQTVAIQVADTLPSTDDALLIAVRIGSKVFFRGGAVLGDGESAQIYETNIWLGVGQRARDTLTMATGQQASSTVPLVVGGVYLDPSEYTVDYLSLEVRFAAVASVSANTITGTVELYNLSDSAVAASLNVTSTSLTKLITGVLTLPSAEKLYEVRIYTSASGTDTINLDWAGLQIDLVK